MPRATPASNYRRYYCNTTTRPNLSQARAVAMNNWRLIKRRASSLGHRCAVLVAVCGHLHSMEGIPDAEAAHRARDHNNWIHQVRLPMLHRQLDVSRLTAVSCSGIMIAYSDHSIELPFCLGELPSSCFQALNRKLLPVSDRQRCCRTMFISCLRRRFPHSGAF